MRYYYITGIPRSGSTWCFNVVRIFLWGAFGEKNCCHGYGRPNWYGDPTTATHHVIKTHKYLHHRLPGPIIHSTRNYEEVLKSWRMTDPARMDSVEELERVDLLWRPHANAIIHRRWLDEADSRCFAAYSILKVLHEGVSFQDAVSVSRQIDNIRLPLKGTDEATMLGHKHIKGVPPEGKCGV